MSDEYFRKPKKARGGHCEAWWYANARSIEIHVEHADTRAHATVKLTRSQLETYLKRTAPKRKR